MKTESALKISASIQRMKQSKYLSDFSKSLNGRIVRAVFEKNGKRVIKKVDRLSGGYTVIGDKKYINYTPAFDNGSTNDFLTIMHSNGYCQEFRRKAGSHFWQKWGEHIPKDI